jgi:predicted membrane protein
MNTFFTVALGVLFVMYVASVVFEALRRSKSVKTLPTNNAPTPVKKQVKQNYIRYQAEDLAEWDNIDYLYCERPHVSSRDVKLEINELKDNSNEINN